MPNPDDLEFYSHHKEDSNDTSEQREELNKKIAEKLAQIQRLTETKSSDNEETEFNLPDVSYTVEDVEIMRILRDESGVAFQDIHMKFTRAALILFRNLADQELLLGAPREQYNFTFKQAKRAVE